MIHYMRPTGFLSPKLEGRAIADRGGHAVYARSPVTVGEALAVWGGEVISRKRLRRAGPEAVRLALQIDEDRFLLSSHEGPADWINHSCEPNAGLCGQIVLVAMRPISAGEEICYDYAMSDGSDYDVIDCRCGAPTCRRRISGRDWRRPELQARYEGYFSPYLQRRIERLRLALVSQNPRRRAQPGAG